MPVTVSKASSPVKKGSPPALDVSIRHAAVNTIIKFSPFPVSPCLRYAHQVHHRTQLNVHYDEASGKSNKERLISSTHRLFP